MKRSTSAQTTECFFWKAHTNEKKCLECGQSRFIEVVTQVGKKVTTEVTQKQFR
jgi:hypothetical protein